mgnify:CR=1 FL=1|jgi:Catalase
MHLSVSHNNTSTKLTCTKKANFLGTVGEKTPVFIRFSTVTFGREYPDQGRNPRGFAIKFYTLEGNYDIVGLNFASRPEHNLNVLRLTLISQSSSAATPFKAQMSSALSTATRETFFWTGTPVSTY